MENLLNPVTLPAPVASAPETINLLSSSSDPFSPHDAHPNIFPVAILSGVSSTIPFSMPMRTTETSFICRWAQNLKQEINQCF